MSHDPGHLSSCLLTTKDVFPWPLFPHTGKVTLTHYCSHRPDFISTDKTKDPLQNKGSGPETHMTFSICFSLVFTFRTALQPLLDLKNFDPFGNYRWVISYTGLFGCTSRFLLSRCRSCMLGGTLTDVMFCPSHCILSRDTGCWYVSWGVGMGVEGSLRPLLNSLEGLTGLSVCSHAPSWDASQGKVAKRKSRRTSESRGPWSHPRPASVP